MKLVVLGGTVRCFSVVVMYSCNLEPSQCLTQEINTISAIRMAGPHVLNSRGLVDAVFFALDIPERDH